MAGLPCTPRTPARRHSAGLLAALVGAAAFLLVAGAPATAEASSYYFEGVTSATAVHLTVTQKPASSLITASLVDDAAGYAASAYDSSGSSEAQAAPVYPGNLVVQGPGLLCEDIFGSDPFPACPVAPPAYPLLADASYPRAQSAHADGNGSPIGTGPFVATPEHADATAAADRNEASSSVAQLSLLAGTPAAVTVGASGASSTLRSADGLLTEHVVSTLADVTIASTLHIDAIRAVDDITIRPGAKPIDHPSITVTGVTVAGQSASIDADGVHVAGQNGPSLTRQLAQQGITVHTVGVTRSDHGLSARSDAAAVAVGFSLPVSGLPYVPNPLPAPFDVIPGVNANGTYVGTLTLGAVGAVAAGQSQPGFDLGGIVPPVAAGAGTAAATGSVTAPATPAQPVTTPGAPAQNPIVAAPRTVVRFVLDAFSIRDLYATLALGTVLLFIGWRGMLVLRRGRPRWTTRFAGRR